MKQGWEIKKLGEVGTFQRGGGFLKSDFVENGFPCIHYGQIHTRFGVKTYKHLTCINEELAFSKSKIAHNGDVIIAITSEDVEGSCKCTAWLGDYDVAVGAHAAIYRHNLNPAFAAYYFNGPHFNFEKIKYARGFKVVEIKPSDIEKISIKFPSITEQERIVAELDCLSGVIEKKREQLKELDALAESIFYTMFGDPITNEKGWEVKKIKEVFSVKIGPFGSLLHNSDYISGGTPLVNPIHMHNERIYPDFDFSVSDDKLKELRNYILHTNDIVLARRGDIGRCAIVGVNEDGYLCGTGSLFMRPTTDINSNFIIKQIRCNSMIEYLTSLAKGATMLNINCKIVEELNFILPPISLQQEFADKIEAIDIQKRLIKESIAKTEELFNSRVAYYFN